MVPKPRALTATFRMIAPSVLASMGLAVCGLWLERVVVPRDLFPPNNEVVGSYLQTVGTVYAVLLAFVVFVVWSQFNETRQFVEQEANELLDLSRTARGFNADATTQIHRHAARYVEAVLGPEWTAMETDTHAGLAPADEILDELWSVLHAMELPTECERAVYAEVLGRLNDLSDARARRVAASRLRIPLALWMLLQFGAVIVVASVYLFDARLATLTAITAALSGALSHVLYVVRDLDNCFAGAWRVPRTPFEDVRHYLERCLAPR